MKHLWFAALVIALIANLAAWWVSDSSINAFASGVFAVVTVNEFIFGLMRL